jgi:HEAT repeat protein
LGRNNPEVLKRLLSLLNNEQSFLHSITVLALGDLGNNSPEVVNPLLSLLNDEGSFLVSCVATALVSLGNNSPELVTRLLSLLNDTSDVRHSAASDLTRLSKTSDTICPEVVQWLEQNPHYDGIGSAIDCLWSIVVE